MAEKRKKWSSLTPQYRSKVVAAISQDTVPHCHEASDFELLFKQFLQRVSREHPHLQEASGKFLQAVESAQCLEGLARLRASAAEDGPYHKPTITVNELDHALVHHHANRAALQGVGYPINLHHYGLVLRNEAVLRKIPGENLGGRPSLVHNPDMIALVKEVLDKHTVESERVVVVGHGAKRRMTVAKHLTHSKHRIWCQHESLHSALGWRTFCGLLRIHFPHVRNPRRDTDICYHCKVLDKELLPDALKCAQRLQDELVKLCPAYFTQFDADQSDGVKYLDKFARFVARKEANAGSDPLRAGLALRSRMALHTLEAEAIHRLKPHVEIVQAYAWHQVSARRQSQFVSAHRAGGLPRSTALVQVDFKENVKYPLSPKETSEEWHAQNKLSLTVFGANAIVPQSPGSIFLSV